MPLNLNNATYKSFTDFASNVSGRTIAAFGDDTTSVQGSGSLGGRTIVPSHNRDFIGNIRRNISATGRSDSESNSINSYVMVHFIYRLNLLGNRDVRGQFGPGGFGEGRGGRGGGFGGGRGGGGNRGGRF